MSVNWYVYVALPLVVYVAAIGVVLHGIGSGDTWMILTGILGAVSSWAALSAGQKLAAR